jgi:hypothetical protein
MDLLGYIDLEKLIEELEINNEAFKKDKDTVLDLFRSEEFRFKEELHADHNKGHKVDTNMVLTLALITCQDDTNGKDHAKVFYELVNPGGYESLRNKQVQSTDDELLGSIEGMMNLVSDVMIRFYHKHDKKGKD